MTDPQATDESYLKLFRWKAREFLDTLANKVSIPLSGRHQSNLDRRANTFTPQYEYLRERGGLLLPSDECLMDEVKRYLHVTDGVLSVRCSKQPARRRLRDRGEAKQVDHWRRDLNAYIKYIDQGDPYSLTPTRSWDSLESKKTAFEEKGFLYPEDVALYNRACQLKRGVTGSTAQGSSAGTVRSRGPQCPTTGANPAQGVTVPGIPGQSIATNPSNRSLIPSQPVRSGNWMTSQRPVPVNPLGSGPPRPIPPGNQGNQGYRVAKPARVSRAPTNPTGQWGQQRQAGISPGPPQPQQQRPMQGRLPAVKLHVPAAGWERSNPGTPQPPVVIFRKLNSCRV